MINIQNKNNECFRYYLFRFLNPAKKKQQKKKKKKKEFAKQLNFKQVKFPVYKKVYAKIEKQNNICINICGYEDETPYHIIFIFQNNLLRNILIYYHYPILKTPIIF